MRHAISVTVVADGSSDEALMPLIKLLLDEHSPHPYRTSFANRRPSGHNLLAKLQAASSDHPRDLPLVHRDAESRPPAERFGEIQRAMTQLDTAIRHVPIVPVRMTESWLSTDERAIRGAVGNPNGRAPLEIPPIARVATVDAKDALEKALEVASEYGARRLRGFVAANYRMRAAELTLSLESLRRVPLFAHFERELGPALRLLA
jgi:hypothetical protein